MIQLHCYQKQDEWMIFFLKYWILIINVALNRPSESQTQLSVSVIICWVEGWRRNDIDGPGSDHTEPGPVERAARAKETSFIFIIFSSYLYYALCIFTNKWIK